MSRQIVLIEYFFTETTLLAFVVRPDLEQPAVVKIETTPEQLRDDISKAAKNQWTYASTVLVQPSVLACMQPVLDWTAPEDIVCIVPSGALFYVPMHAIEVQGAPLIVRNPVFYAPSASALRYCARRRQGPDDIRRDATVFGNPTGDLPYAAEEASAVARLLGGEESEPFLESEVTRQRWFEAMAGSDIIHFAGHGEFDDEDPLASCLVLAGDDLLTARDLFGADARPIRLITLSGCQTGVNLVHPGDELLGLTRALLYAGASSLLVTLWRVNDASSSELMTAFYRHWLHGNTMKVDALRAAQMDMLNTGRTDPYYWAPFVLIGDWV